MQFQPNLICLEGRSVPAPIISYQVDSPPVAIADDPPILDIQPVPPTVTIDMMEIYYSDSVLTYDKMFDQAYVDPTTYLPFSNQLDYYHYYDDGTDMLGRAD